MKQPPSSDSSAFAPAGSDLTTRARAVLAELDEDDAIDACAAVAVLDDKRESCPSAGFDIAAEHGMIRLDVSAGCSRWIVSDLGREVARLLAEGGA